MDTLQPALRASPALFSRAASFPRNTLEPSVGANHAEAAELLYLLVAQIPQIPIGRTPLSAFPFRPNIAAIFQFRPSGATGISMETVSRGIMLSCGHPLHPSRLSLWPGPARRCPLMDASSTDRLSSQPEGNLSCGINTDILLKKQ